MKTIYRVLVLVATVPLLFACEGTTDDPETASKDDLAPPGKVITLTGDKEITLRWPARNVEEGFVGFYVFQRDASSGSAAAKAKFPTGVDVTISGVPRCVTNSDFFAAFNAALATDKECESEDDSGDSDGTADGTTVADTYSGMIQDDEALTGFVTCSGETGTSYSKALTSPQLGNIECKLTGLTNGVTYEFIVASIMDEGKTISWTSPLVSDTPSQNLLTDDVTDVTLAADTYRKIEITIGTDGTVSGALSDAAACSDSTICLIGGGANTASSDTPTIFLGRGKSGQSYPQRLFISTSSTSFNGDDTIKLQARGPQTWDPLANSGAGAKTNRIPGDMAADTYPDADGQRYVVYNNQVFDFEITSGGDKWYGKVVIGDVSYASTDNTSDATIKLSVIMQPKSGVRHYFQ